MSIKNNFPAIKPSLNLDFANVKKLDPRVTFARASEGRYYDGVTTAKAEENLVLRSQEFDNGIWAKFRATVSADDTTAPDGTTTADKLIANTDNNSHGCSSGVVTVKPATAYTYSVYAKSAGYDWLFLQGYDASNGGTGTAYFNLSAGTVGTTSGTITASIVSAGNGWYRCIVQIDPSEFTATAVHNFYAQIASADNTNSFAGDGTSGIYIWGYQVEQRSAVTAYTPTTSQPITNYIPVLQTASANVARFDHDPVTGESLGLLVEEQRTNLVTYSEDFGNAAWTKNNATVQSNVVVAPDGTLTGDKLVENTANGTHYVLQTVSLLASTTYTFTVYVKAGERTFIALQPLGFSDAVYYNLTTGTVATISGSPNSSSITPVGNGWYRCSVSSTTSSAGFYNSYLYLASADNVPTYTGDGYSGIYIWGAQLEAGAFPTSYIPTTSSQVTRSADAASMTGTNFSEWYRADEMTIYAEAYSPKGAGTGGNANHLFSINDPSLNNRIRVYRTADKATFAFEVRNSGSIQASITSGSLDDNVLVKISASLKANDFAYVRSGVLSGTDTSGLVPSNPTRLEIGIQDAASATSWNSTIKKLAIYPLRLSNANLQALTGS